jgi:PAS domain S-box-containing protein
VPTNPFKLLQTPVGDFSRYIRDAVIIANAEFQIVHWNVAAESLYGWKAEEAIGQKGIQLLKTEFSEAKKSELLAEIQRVGFYRGADCCRNRLDRA